VAKYGDTSFRGTLKPNEQTAYDAFNDLKASADYKKRNDMAGSIPNKDSDPQGYKDWWKKNGEEYTRLETVIYGAEKSILDRTGVNPKELGNRAAQAAGYAPTYANTALTEPKPWNSPAPSTGNNATSAGSGSKAPGSKSGSGYGGSGRGSGAGGSSAGSQKAGDDFFTAYRELSPTDKRLVRGDKDVAAVLTSGKHTEQQYVRALDRLNAVIEKSNGFGQNAANPANRFQRTEGVFTGVGPGLTPAQLARGVDSVINGQEQIIPGFAERAQAYREQFGRAGGQGQSYSDLGRTQGLTYLGSTDEGFPMFKDKNGNIQTYDPNSGFGPASYSGPLHAASVATYTSAPHFNSSYASAKPSAIGKAGSPTIKNSYTSNYGNTSRRRR
jgi:hypothetical protein